MGIEPTYPAWKAGVLPLNYTRSSLPFGNAQFRNRTRDTRIFSPLLYQLSYLGPRLNPSCNLYFMTALRHNNRSLHKFRSNVKWLIEKNLNFCNYSSISYKCFG